MSITITLPLPPRALHPNARKHWRAKMKPKKDQRLEAYWSARAVISEQVGPLQVLNWKLAEVQSTWYLARRNDADNLIAWLKATNDGLADAGIVDNDRGFIFMPPKQVTGKAAKGRREVVLTITKR